MSGRDRILIGVFLRILIGVFLLVNVAAVLVVLRIAGSGGDAVRSQATPGGRVVVNQRIGARIDKPRKWKEKRQRRAIELLSPDSSTVMSISRPTGATKSSGLLRAAVATIRRRYRHVSVRRRRLSGQVSGLPTASTVLRATNRKGTRLTILLSAPQGRARAWLVKVSSGPGARAKRLPEARSALGTLLLRG